MTATAESRIEQATRFYRPRGAAKSLFPCRDPEVLIEGPAGTGKTRGVLEKVNRWLLKCPGSRGLIVRKTRKSMTESVLVTYEERIIPQNADLYPDTQTQQRKTRDNYVYPNGSSLVVGGMDNPDRIMSTEYDVIAAFEATELTEDDWEKLTTRLRNGVMPFQQAIADCNPSVPSHWLNARANRPYAVPPEMAEYFPSVRDGQKQMMRLLSRHQDNPSLYDDATGKWTARGAQYIATLTRLTGARKLRLLNGTWAAQEGLVWEDYDAAVHLIDPFPIPSDWRRIRTIDFGYTNPFVCLWIAFDPDGRMYVYRQWYRTKTLVQDHAAKIKELTGTERIEATISDHDAEDRATLYRYGIATAPARKEVQTGIEAVSLRLRKAGDDRPRIFILRDSLVEEDAALVESKLPTCLEQEIEGYIWAPSIDGRPVKEEPLKLNDHACDALRYGVMHRQIVRRPGEVILMGQR